MIIILNLLVYSRLNHTPFGKHAQGEITMRTYNAEVSRLVCLLLRAKEGPYPFQFPEGVQNNIDELQEAIESGEVKDNDLIIYVRDLLHSVWSYSWSPGVTTKVTTDPTLLWLAFRMLGSHGGFRDANQTTPVIARIEYCMRLIPVMFLGEASLQGKSNQEIQNLWNNDLAQYYTVGNSYTFHSLVQLQHYATALVFNQISLPRIVWEDRHSYRKMLYLGDRIAFDQLQHMFAYLEQECITLWEEKLMLGTGLSIDWYQTPLADDLTNKTPGYSLFSDTRNGCFSNKTQLLSAILSSPSLRKRFITGYDMGTNMPTWNKVELRKWLMDYSSFHRLMILRWEILGGSPIRGTEIVSMLYQNTQTRQRNLVALSDHIAAVAMYHKSGAITKQDKLLPHAGDAITADLAVQDFGLARPFAKLAAVLCYPTSHEVHSAYRNLMFVNQGRAFESDEISDTMAKITLAQLGVRLGMNGYRHVSIAFRRMLVDKVSEADFQEDLARQIDAEQASHSERVEHSHYAISLDSFAQHSDQRVGLFCDASVRWQNKCQVVPGGTRKPYHEVRSAQYDNLRTQGLFQDDTDDKQGNQQIVTIIKEVISPLLQQLENSLLSKLTQVAKGKSFT